MSWAWGFAQIVGRPAAQAQHRDLLLAVRLISR
jgi:hypothetical protein